MPDLRHAPWSPSSHSSGTGAVGLVRQEEQQMSEQQGQQVSEQGGALWQEGGAWAPVARGSSEMK